MESVTNKTFASLFTDNRKAGNGLSLNYLPSYNANTVSFSDEEWKEGENLWGNALIGHVIGLNVKFKSMESYVSKLWGSISIPKVSLIKQGLFLFDFHSEKSMRDILEAGPWFFGSRPLMLKPWNIETDLDRMQDFYYPMWIQLPNLRLNLRSSTGISKVASLIGKPISTDKLTATRQRLSYARVLIEVKLPLNDSLPDQLTIKGPDGSSYVQPVIYEYKPKWCTICCKIGHDNEQCRRIKTKKMWVPVAKQTVQEEVNPELIVTGNNFTQQDSDANIGTSAQEGKAESPFDSPNQKALLTGKRAQKHAQTVFAIQVNETGTGKAVEYGINAINDLQSHQATPSVNATGFSSISRAKITRRVSIIKPANPGIQLSLFSSLDNPSCVDRGGSSF
ncbi:uncharacterized protein LOC109839325 [Asparagus officinalis]|uniref:uncharacterized protein LOC109839325 n=1 Tax=Asparagus officinalis TaxID=4686 RepID=UPI00098E009E|nr:uncharacterized protein LOC109839325 [Asparagus officinalis]